MHKQLRRLAVSIALGFSIGAAQADTQAHTKSWEYNTDGSVTKETIEPDRPNDCVQTTYTYDTTSGVRNGVTNSSCTGATGYTISSAGTLRTTQLNISSSYPDARTNPMGLSEKGKYDVRIGALTSRTDAGGLQTSWEYDQFARPTREIRPDKTATIWTRRLCSYADANCPAPVGSAPVNWVQIEQAYGSDNKTFAAPELRKYFDALGRVVRVQTKGFDGNGATAPTIVQDTWYDAQGRVAQTSNPYALGTETPVWTAYSYDALGRVTQESHPDSAAPGGVATTTYTYNGLTTSTTNSKNQTKTAIRNAQGLIAQVIDAKGASIAYSYDSVGNLTQVNASGAITTLTYNQRGQKIGMVDATMGSWQYAYNAFGELVWQQDSLGRQVTLAYDLNGRLTQRNEPDLVSQWSWDKNFDGTGCGRKDRVCEATANNGYRRLVTYDGAGRPLTTSLMLDGIANHLATVSETYDNNRGFVLSKTWPSGFKATYSYSASGFLTGVAGTDSGGTQRVSYSVSAMNSQGKVTEYKTGNNVTTVRNFDAQTNRLLGLTATTDGQAQGNVLANSYTYDSVGNLVTRVDNTPGIGTQESFQYDNVNRLTLASISGGGLPTAQLTEVQYNDLGNITYKSDVGTYWYDSQRPSRMVNVTLDTPASAQVPLTGTRQLSYAFDDTNAGAQTVNGITVGNGNLQYTVQQDTVNSIHTVRSETYTSFNMPQQIVYGNFVTSTSSTADRTLTFTYGPEHQRLKQTIALSGNGTSSYTSGTIYYMNGIDSLGLSYERAILTNGIKEDKHYVAAGGQVFAIFVSRTGQLGSTPATTTSYIHQDRLTSVGAIVDETGVVKERFAYDPWGKRRYTNGTNDVLDSTVGNNTRRGFTMQEHLDEVGVIHMNARIYDPLVGRFMSADSIIPNPADLKSFNRYTYLDNNPLSGTDSTGHVADDGPSIHMPKADWGLDGAGGTSSAGYAASIGEGWGDISSNAGSSWSGGNTSPTNSTSTNTITGTVTIATVAAPNQATVTSLSSTLQTLWVAGTPPGVYVTVTTNSLQGDAGSGQMLIATSTTTYFSNQTTDNSVALPGQTNATVGVQVAGGDNTTILGLLVKAASATLDLANDAGSWTLSVQSGVRVGPLGTGFVGMAITFDGLVPSDAGLITDYSLPGLDAGTSWHFGPLVQGTVQAGSLQSLNGSESLSLSGALGPLTGNFGGGLQKDVNGGLTGGSLSWSPVLNVGGSIQGQVTRTISYQGIRTWVDSRFSK